MHFIVQKEKQVTSCKSHHRRRIAIIKVLNSYTYGQFSDSMESFMEEKIEQAYLYDFYGELLNERQRQIYEDYIFNDLSLGEIASEQGISRQGVHDMIKRCTRTLESYEQKLQLIRKFQSAKTKVGQIHVLAKRFHENHEEAVIEEIEQISNQILEEL